MVRGTSPHLCRQALRFSPTTSPVREAMRSEMAAKDYDPKDILLEGDLDEIVP